MSKFIGFFYCLYSYVKIQNVNISSQAEFNVPVFVYCSFLGLCSYLYLWFLSVSIFLRTLIVPICVYVFICAQVFFIYLPMFYSVSKFNLCLWVLSVSLFRYVSASLCVCVQSVTMVSVCAMASICVSSLICDYCSCLCQCFYSCQLVLSGSTFLFISVGPDCVYIPVCMDRNIGMKRNTCRHR